MWWYKTYSWKTWKHWNWNIRAKKFNWKESIECFGQMCKFFVTTFGMVCLTLHDFYLSVRFFFFRLQWYVDSRNVDVCENVRYCWMDIKRIFTDTVIRAVRYWNKWDRLRSETGFFLFCYRNLWHTNFAIKIFERIFGRYLFWDTTHHHFSSYSVRDGDI